MTNIYHSILFANLLLIRLLLFYIEPMDLPYPTVKKSNLHSELNQLDKLARSILLSTHDIPKQDSISKSLKSKIQRAIQCDNPRKLDYLIKRQVIPFTVEIGTRGSRWNLLHFCAKNNAYQCIQYALKTQYQQYQDQYQSLVNAKTVEGYTILAVAIINRSHKVLQKIFEFGGVDIHVLDQHKQDVYSIANSYRNEKAIQLLMSYQSKTKKKQFLNREALTQPIKFPKQTCCQQLTACLLSCLTFGFYEQNDGLQVKTENMTKITDFVIQEEIIDFVAINSKKQLGGYEIQWKKAPMLMTGRVTLFDSYNPFDIKQINFGIKNNLIIFQCLSQQPWLLRKSIKPDRCRNNHYNVYLYPKKMLQKQNVDDYIPFIKDRQAMFLSNQQEMWPMILQKALAKLHNSYFAIAQLKPLQLIEQITGFPTVQIPISSIKKSQIITFLQETTAKNYLYILKGKEGSELRNQNEQNSVECFTVLNFYQKNQKSLVLINCPFSSEKWKQKQQKQQKQRKDKLTEQQKMEQLTLKLIKGHYNAHKQMCVWIDTNKMKDYFQSIIVSLSFSNYQRSQLKIKTKEHVFFKFRVQNQKDQNIYFQLSNAKTSEVFDLSKLQIIKNQGKQYAPPLEKGDINNYDPNLSEIQCLPGEYMCFLQTEAFKNMQSLLLLCWSAEPIQPQFVQPELGILEWLGFLKNLFFKGQERCVLQVIGEFSLVIFREATNNIALFKMNVESDCIIEGKKDEESGYVEMISEQNVHYCVLKKIIKSEQVNFESKKKVAH